MAAVGGNKMIGYQVTKKLEPEKRDLRQHPALVRNTGGEHIIEGGDPVGGDEQQTLLVEEVDVADFAAGMQLQFREVGLQENGVEKLRVHDGNSTGRNRRVF